MATDPISWRYDNQTDMFLCIEHIGIQKITTFFQIRAIIVLSLQIHVAGHKIRAAKIQRQRLHLHRYLL